MECLFRSAVLTVGLPVLTKDASCLLGSMLSEGRRADKDHRTRWLHWWYRKLQLCYLLL